jgi:arylsulfatase
MSQSSLIGLCICLSAVPLARAGAPKDAAKPARPNVIIVMTDDQGYGDFSCHGNPILRTPNLDKLRAKSVRFTDFHSAPMCTPSRGQIMTGLDALRNGATSVTAGRAFMRPGLPTLPQLFRNAGYRTGIFGKWHLGDNYPHRPNDRGFEKAVYHLGWGMTAAPEFVGKLFDGRYFEDGVEKQFKGYMTDFWFDRAIAWMRERHAKSEPFLCYIPTNAPHAPHVVDPKYSVPYQKHKKAADFFGMIANIDENVGRLAAFLEQSGLAENTIVVFMTDNGGTAGVNLFNAGMRGRKTMYYEGGHRVPCWITWGGKTPLAPLGSQQRDRLSPPGALSKGERGAAIARDIRVPTQMQDLLPTLLDLCDIAPPKSAQFDGTSLAGLLRGSQSTLPDRMLVVQYGQIPKMWESCVIWNQWRLVHGKELYDIHADPGQEKDVAAAQPDVLKKMRAHYERWWAGVESRLNDFVPTSIGSPRQPLVPLTSSDWQNIYSDNAGHVRNAVGGPRGGQWTLLVETPGDYEIAVRRWPRETDLPLGGDAGKMSKTITPAAAKLTIAGQELTVNTSPTEQESTFRVTLKQGSTLMQAWFQDGQGEDLCGAFFAYVVRKE